MRVGEVVVVVEAMEGLGVWFLEFDGELVSLIRSPVVDSHVFVCLFGEGVFVVVLEFLGRSVVTGKTVGSVWVGVDREVLGGGLISEGLRVLVLVVSAGVVF